MNDLDFPLMYERPGPLVHWPPFLDFYQRSVSLFHVDATPSEDIYHPELRAWIAPDTFDYATQENGWKRLLEQCPQAQLCLRLYIASPPWWDETHPDELQQYFEGRVEHTFLHTTRQTLPSLASQRWLEDSAKAMRHFLGWLEESGWSQRVWGLFLCYGITWEWGILGSDGWLDYSRPMRRYFRSWLRRTYGADEQLQTVWGDTGVTLETAAVPSPEQRRRADGDLRIFPRDRAAYDFQRCLSDANVEYLLHLAQAVREASGDSYRLGTFYGYTLTARAHDDFVSQVGAGGLQGGHHSLRRLQESRLFDFLASPYAYVNRNLDEGVLIQHYPLRGAQHNGLHGYEENDLWTFTNPPQGARPNSIGATDTREASILHQRLALVQALCRGTSYWWTDLTDSRKLGREVSNYSDPRILDEIERHRLLFGQINSCEIGSTAAQIAIVIDEESKDALSLESKLFLREVYEQLPQWAWCGAPFDVWLTSDVEEETMQPYCLVYCFAPFVSEATRTRLQRVLCTGERTVWWAPYSGWLTERGQDDAAFQRLTGMEYLAPIPDRLRRREQGGWTSLYGPCAGQSSTQLADIAQQAGVHLYGQAPLQVMARRSLIGVHAREAGDYRLHFPDGHWREVFSHEIMEVKNGASVFGFATHDVRLFLRETAR
jgi:hypothetical protein